MNTNSKSNLHCQIGSKGGSCPKGGVKIHETYSSNSNNNFKNNNNINNNSKPAIISQEDFFNQLKSQNKHTGVRVNETGNHYKEDPFGNINPFANPDGETSWKRNEDGSIDLYKLDLDINNYSMDDIYNLFNIRNKASLTMDVMKEAKKTVLKMHPDKSKMEAKYFLFFSSAYKMLYSIYEFQNKNNYGQAQAQAQAQGEQEQNLKNVNKEVNKMINLLQPQAPNTPKSHNLEQIVLQRQAADTAFNETHSKALNTFFENNKDMLQQNGGKGFNNWFNEQFEQCKIVDEGEAAGYGSWLTSDEGVNTAEVKTAQDMEKYKKQVQSLVTYNGVQDMTTSFGFSLMTSGDNFSGDGFTDLRQAYEQSVIPVTMEDYERMDKDMYKSLDAYQNHRNRVDTTPSNTRDAMRTLFQQNEDREAQNAALAYYHAKQTEEAKKKQEGFWATLMKITNF